MSRTRVSGLMTETIPESRLGCDRTFTHVVATAATHSALSDGTGAGVGAGTAGCATTAFGLGVVSTAACACLTRDSAESAAGGTDGVTESAGAAIGVGAG